MTLDLAIVIITYNRSTYLRRTLTALSQSVFKDCSIWVLNNASPDDTREVCQEFNLQLSNLHAVTHRFNIGGPANALRAYEYGDRYYTWIVCDDDVLQLNQVDDLVEALEHKRCDLIRVYGGTSEEQGQVYTLGELLHDPDSFTFYSIGFLPAIIFRQDQIEPYVQHGYPKIGTLYPQLFVLMGGFGIHTQVYTTRQQLLQRGEAPMSIGSEILLAQLQSLEALPTRRARQVAMSWRRKRQKWLGYVLGYGRLILTDLRFGRSRRMIFRIWLKTIVATPSILTKAAIALNGFFMLLPIRPIYYLIRKKKMESASYPTR
jgi:glycosyltransferase involved in cell wall biosynthesis